MEAASTNGLARLVASTTESITLSCGTELHFNKVTIEDYANRETYIVSRRAQASIGLDTETLGLVLLAKDPDVRRAILSAVENVVQVALTRPIFATSEEAAAFDASDRGRAYMLFMCLRKTPSNRVFSVDDAIVLYNTLVNRKDAKDYTDVLMKMRTFSLDALQGNSLPPSATTPTI